MRIPITLTATSETLLAQILAASPHAVRTRVLAAATEIGLRQLSEPPQPAPPPTKEERIAKIKAEWGHEAEQTASAEPKPATEDYFRSRLGGKSLAGLQTSLGELQAAKEEPLGLHIPSLGMWVNPRNRDALRAAIEVEMSQWLAPAERDLAVLRQAHALSHTVAVDIGYNGPTSVVATEPALAQTPAAKSSQPPPAPLPEPWPPLELPIEDPAPLPADDERLESLVATLSPEEPEPEIWANPFDALMGDDQ